MDTKKFKVGIMSHTAVIEAPSPEAAVLFYGLNTNGNATCMAAIYEVDGIEYVGDKAPLIKYQFGVGLPADLVHRLKDEMKACKVISWQGLIEESKETKMPIEACPVGQKEDKG
jgi:hypothetical protein